MMRFLIVPLDRSAISFCYYENPMADLSPEPIGLDVLNKAARFTLDHDLTVNFLYGNAEVPEAHRTVIQGVRHAAFVPPSLAKAHPGSVVVLDAAQAEQSDALGFDMERNIILRISWERIGELSGILRLLVGKFRRLNLCILGIGKLAGGDMESYAAQLAEIVELAAYRYGNGESFELSFLTDRLLLDEMKNCDAGIEHLTMGFDGSLYICPGFMYETPTEPVGSVDEGVRIRNDELLRLDHAPVCSLCDAFHCKRCFYLNKRLTLEINTPSRQQCVLSHMERNASAALYSRQRHLPAFQAMKPIPEIDYLDPFDLLARNSMGKTVASSSEEPRSLPPLQMIDPWTHPDPSLRPPSAAIRPPGKVPDVVRPGGNPPIEDLLRRVLEQQTEILGLLRKKEEAKLP